MAFTIDPTAIIVGAGQIYQRALSVLTPWTNVGATMDDTVIRVNQTWFRPDLNGMLGPIQELDYKSEEVPEIEFTMMELSATNAALVIPGSTSTTGTGAEAGATHLTTTLSAAATAGSESIAVVATTNAIVGDYIKIGTGSTAEYRTITSITALVVGFRDPLQSAHAAAETVVETTDTNQVIITGSAVRRMPSSAYKQWALVGQAPDGIYAIEMTSGISVTESAELSFGDDSAAGFRTTIQGRYVGTAPLTAPWTIRVPV